jgi:hypothetical protein
VDSATQPWPEVHDSAHKHGIADADGAHAVIHHLYAGDIADDDRPPWRVLYLGPTAREPA